jgi:hypothetical protein
VGADLRMGADEAGLHRPMTVPNIGKTHLEAPSIYLRYYRWRSSST